MAKKREVTITSFNMNEKGVELKAKVTFSLKLFEGDVSQEHTMNVDLSMTKDQAVNDIMSTIVIDAQKAFRALGDHAKVREMTRKTLSYADIHPKGTGVVKMREMTLAEIVEKAKTSDAYRAELLKQLGAIQA